MENRIKLLVIGLGALALILLLIAFQLNSANNKVRARSLALEQELNQANQENDKLAKKFSDASIQIKSLNSSLNESEAKSRSLQEEINLLNERLDRRLNEIGDLNGKIESLKKDKDKLREEIEKAKEKKSETEEDIPLLASPGSAHEAYWGQVLREKAALELQLQNINVQLKEITYKADELFKAKNSLEMQLKDTAQLKEDLERSSSYNEKLANALSQDLVREKNDKEALANQIDKIRDDNKQMRARIEDLENTKTTLYKKIDNLEQERGALKGKLKDTENSLSERAHEIVRIKSDIEEFQAKEMPEVVPGSRTVELSPIVVYGKEGIDLPVLTGRVSSFNKEHGFVIIDLGEAQGININNTFGVYRDNKFIASIQVIQARRDISAADIREVSVGEEIKVGDIVKLIN